MTHHDPSVAPHLGISERLQHISDLELLEGLSVEGEDSPGDVSTIGCVAARYALQSFLQDERFSRFSSGGARRDGMVTGKDLATSRLSPHVRFGEISPRILFYAVVDAGAQAKTKGNERGLEAARTFLKNMSLREFGYYMLGRYPHAACKPIMPEFEVFPWVYDKDGMMAKAWETGNTGFPIVDAAMRQLIREGWIHNRMRFLAASFFCKYLLLPWPVGAAHMVRTLVDGDEACNSLGWQWTAGCNSDSFPFSTLVNPLSLHTHSQSTKRAAEYVRKYVPELAGLPDSLVFTPWKASNAERKLYRLGLVPLDEYRMINRHWNHTSPSPTCIHKTYLYPDRIVHGPQARIRARNAMEVMRRIFSAQRQCRTIIVDQTIAPEGRVRVSERETLMIEAPTSTEDVMDLDQNEEMMSSVTGTSSSTGNALKKYAPRSGEDLPSIVQSPRKKQRLEDEGVSSPHWNQKVSCSETTDVMAVSPTSIGSSSISRGEVDLLLSSREVPNRKTKRRPRPSATETHTKTERVDDCLTQAPLAQLTGTLKKRRPSTEAMPPTADGRVSVQALLTPTIMDPTKASVLSSRSPVQMPDSFPNIQGRSNLTHLPSTSSFGSHLTRTLDSHPAGMQSMSSAMHAQPPPLLYTHFQKPTPDATSAHHQKMSSSRNNEPFIPTISSFSDRTSQQFRSMSEQHIRESRVDHVESSLRGVPAPGRQAIPPANMSNVRQTHVHGSGGTNPHVVQVKERNHSRHTGFDVNRPHASSICQQGVPGMAVMPNHFSGNHPHRAPMVLPFRPGGPVHVAPTGPQPSGLPRQNGGQGYFHPMNPHMNAQPAGPMIFYPSVPQYIDMRVPQMMQPMVTPHPGALPMSFPGANRTMLGAGLNDGRMLTPNGTHRGLTAVDRGSQNGPKNPMEREEIARQMAAMNYYDEAYGGKHWEQWQAIALHLLDQYEFSEDTNRLTTKSYVRLCVLKDELRDANPSGPRVTVNHCKEVFRILQLPVTGEWDRRGHGGVRGPYCYGCVKRSGVQISKK